MKRGAKALSAFEMMSRGERLVGDYATTAIEGPQKGRRAHSDWVSLADGARKARKHYLTAARTAPNEYERQIAQYKAMQRKEEIQEYSRNHAHGRPLTLERQGSPPRSPIAESSAGTASPEGARFGEYGFGGPSQCRPRPLSPVPEEQPKRRASPPPRRSARLDPDPTPLTRYRQRQKL